MNPQLVQWTCNLETHECLWIERPVLNAIIYIGVAILAIGVGWLIDVILAERRK